MSDGFRKFAGFALACFAFWAVCIGVAMSNISWFAFAAFSAALSMIVWGE